MANPQAENGHIDIANEIAEALYKTNLSAYESRILWFIFRKTYGWHKKEDRISYSQFEETGIARQHIHRTLQQLKERNIVTISGNGRRLTYGLQKDYTKWSDGVKGRAHSIATPKGNKSPESGTNVTSRGNDEVCYLKGDKNDTSRGNKSVT